MKKIEAIIRPEKLDAVRRALDGVGSFGLIITEVEGRGKQKGTVQQWRGEKYRVELLPKLKVEIIAKDNEVDGITKVIVDSAKTGETGDGKVFVYQLENVIRIRTGETGESAI